MNFRAAILFLSLLDHLTALRLRLARRGRR